jgi:hypothetical protein
VKFTKIPDYISNYARGKTAVADIAETSILESQFEVCERLPVVKNLISLTFNAVGPGNYKIFPLNKTRQIAYKMLT